MVTMTTDTSHSKNIPTIFIFQYGFMAVCTPYTTPHNRKDKGRDEIPYSIIKNSQYHQSTNNNG